MEREMLKLCLLLVKATADATDAERKIADVEALIECSIMAKEIVRRVEIEALAVLAQDSKGARA